MFSTGNAVTIMFALSLATAGILTAIACGSAKSHAYKDINRPSDEITIELTASGFNPAAVAHAAGAFGIAIENKNGASEYTLELKEENGTVLNQIPVQKGSAAWSVNLQPGRYTLTEVHHEQWVCVITVH